jgi:hypothetical protein
MPRRKRERRERERKREKTSETKRATTSSSEKLCAHAWRGSLCFIAAAFCTALVQMLVV